MRHESSPAAGGRPWAVGLALGAIALAAALLRLHRLTFQSLWYDELFSVVFAHPRLSVAAIVETYATDVHPLGYPLLLHFWMKAFGATDFAARLLSALAGVAAIPAVYALGRAVRDRRTGLVAALLAAVNAFHLYYSQEARSYALLFLLAATTFTALLALVDRPALRTAALYALPAALAVHTHYYGVILVGTQLGAAGLISLVRRRPIGPLLTAAGLVALAALPWIVPLARAAGMEEYWPPLPGPLFFAGYFHEFFGRSAPLTAAIAALLAWLPFALRRERPLVPETGAPAGWPLAERAGLLALVVVVCLAVPYAWSRWVVSMMQARFSMIFLPALLALVALAVARLPGHALRAAVIAGLGIGSVVHLVHSGYYTKVRNEQWREAGEWAFAHPELRRPADRFASELAPGFQFYFDQQRRDTTVEETSRLDLGEAARALRGRGGLWLLVARNRRGTPEFQAELERRFRKEAERRFVGAAAELWIPRRQPRRPGSPEDVTAP